MGGPRLFSQKNSKIPRPTSLPPPPPKKRPSLIACHADALRQQVDGEQSLSFLQLATRVRERRAGKPSVTHVCILARFVRRTKKKRETARSLGSRRQFDINHIVFLSKDQSTFLCSLQAGSPYGLFRYLLSNS